MSRLIVKDKYGEFEPINHNEVCEKLYKLKTIEQDLGCPLEVVFKALKKGSIEDENGGIQIVGITIGGYGELYLHAINGDLYLLKDYQKTWCLKGDRSE